MKWTSFGAQVIYGLIAGVVLGLIASSMPEGTGSLPHSPPWAAIMSLS